jgi:hypothetical protein
VRTLDELILDDARAVALASMYRATNQDSLARVPSAGEAVTICEIGSHCRGAVFTNAAALATRALESAVDRSARAMPGFSFGRFDVRAESEQALGDGRFTILELNGITSEPTHVYDPSFRFVDGVRTLARTWSLAFEIGAGHAGAGARVWSVGELLGMVLAHRRFAASWPESASRPIASLDPP